MDKLKKNGPEEIVFQGKIFEVVKQPMKVGDKDIVFEMVRRSPGVRLFIVKDKQLLLTKEYRTELDGYDYRLPGGKVFDRLEEYLLALKKGENILTHAKQAAKKEAVEETGINILNIYHFYTAKSGATVDWDLFYFVAEDFEELPQGQSLELGEVIEVEWKDFSVAREMCIDGRIKEDRSVGVILKFLENKKSAE